MRVKNGSPECLFEKVGRNQASTFPGFCSRHDTEIFKPLDTKPLSLDDAEQLFLIAYRSLTRELHTVMEAAMRLQTTLERQIAEGLVPKDKPLGSAGLIAHEVIAPEPVRVAFSGRSLLV